MKELSRRKLLLYEELTTSARLIELGLGEIQSLGGTNDFRHLPFQLLSSGIERLLKCHICFGYFEQYGSLPSFSQLKKSGGKSGHDLIELLKVVTSDYFQRTTSILSDDYKFITENKKTRVLLELLSEFGKYSRYHNLDIVTGAEKPSRDIESEWSSFEVSIALEHEDIINQIGDVETAETAIAALHRQIIILLERFLRCLARQFTIGNLGTLAKQHSTPLHYFILLEDKNLGTRNYRQEITTWRANQKKSRQINIIDNLSRKLNSNIVVKKVVRSDFGKEWAFYNDDVIIECREQHWCVVTINGVDYALNGAAKGRYKLENVHDAGMAILGISLKPYIDLCSDMWNENKT